MRGWLLLAAMLICPAAVADLFTANLAYQKGDYERAAHDYRELAELGQPLAQYNLAVMYLNGQGLRESELNAYVWASLSAENGYPAAKALADQLRPQLAPGSEKLAAEIAAPFSRASLDARLLPQLEDDVEREARCRSDKHQVELAGRYPRAALATGQQGSVVVRYTLMPDGSSRNPRILYAVPPGTFERTVRTAILHLHSPEDPRAAPADCSVMYRFVMAGSTFDGLKDFAKNVRVEAEAGKPAAQLTYGMLLANFPGELAVKKSDSVPWFLKAAQAGSPQAQFAVGTSLTLNGWGCHCDETKGEVWLRKAAEADHPAAQVGLATYALRGSPTEANTRLASVWLERAAKNGDQEGMFYLAALLAATPFADLRDPGRALALLEKVQGEFSNNPSLNEIRAAAQAGGGDFKAAVASEQHAIGSARVVSWNLAPLKERLARYQASQAWYGNLLAL